MNPRAQYYYQLGQEDRAAGRPQEIPSNVPGARLPSTDTRLDRPGQPLAPGQAPYFYDQGYAAGVPAPPTGGASGGLPVAPVLGAGTGNTGIVSPMQFYRNLGQQDRQAGRPRNTAWTLPPGPGPSLAEIQAWYDEGFGVSLPSPPAQEPPPPTAFRTWEVIGRMHGQIRPLTEVIAQQGSGGDARGDWVRQLIGLPPEPARLGWSILPGGAVTVGNEPGDGSGVAGAPGQWALYAGGQPPEAFGLDPGKGVLAMAQGTGGQTRPYPLTALVLQDIFGAGWRQTIYG